MLLEYPTLTHVIFQVQNTIAPVTRALLYRTMVAPAVRDATRFVKRERPDLVFSTHFFATMALIEARRRSRLRFTIVTYQTEMFTFHAPWKVPETDWYHHGLRAGGPIGGPARDRKQQDQDLPLPHSAELPRARGAAGRPSRRSWASKAIAGPFSSASATRGRA